MRAIGVIAVKSAVVPFDHGETYLASLGENAHELRPWRPELEAGVRVVISSDSDVSSFRPLTTIANAMRRRTREGVVLGPHHRLTLDEALFAHTIDAAFAVGLEREIGSIEAGKLADLTLLDGDVGRAAPDELEPTPVRETIVGGETVYPPADGVP